MGDVSWFICYIFRREQLRVPGEQDNRRELSARNVLANKPCSLRKAALQ